MAAVYPYHAAHLWGEPHMWGRKLLSKPPCPFWEVQVLHLRIFNYDSTLAPLGKTVLQVTIESDYDAWMGLERDEIAYAAEKAEQLAWSWNAWKNYTPGAYGGGPSDVATPYTFWFYTRNYRASYEGWLMTKTAVQTLLPKTLPGLRNFYMAGQWVEPGGVSRRCSTFGSQCGQNIVQKGGEAVQNFDAYDQNIIKEDLHMSGRKNLPLKRPKPSEKNCD